MFTFQVSLVNLNWGENFCLVAFGSWISRCSWSRRRIILQKTDFTTTSVCKLWKRALYSCYCFNFRGSSRSEAIRVTCRNIIEADIWDVLDLQQIKCKFKKIWPLLQVQLPLSKEVYYFLFVIWENPERTIHTHSCYHQHAEGARK